MGTPLGPKYIPYTYMDPLGLQEMPHPNGDFTLHDGPPYANGSLHMGRGTRCCGFG